MSIPDISRTSSRQSFGGNAVSRDINLSVAEGELFVILGFSGHWQRTTADST